MSNDDHTQVDMEVLSLDEIFASVWAEITAASKNRRGAFHTPTIATNSNYGPQARVVVLRKVAEVSRELTFHTDYRTDKIKELQADPRLSFLFYNPVSKVQIRAAGVARIHYQDDYARERWADSNQWSRRCYLAPVRPGLFVEAPQANFPTEFIHRPPDEAESEPGFANFCAVSGEINFIDWLFLKTHGHVRAQFHWDGLQWRKTWVTP